MIYCEISYYSFSTRNSFFLLVVEYGIFQFIKNENFPTH